MPAAGVLKLLLMLALFGGAGCAAAPEPWSAPPAGPGTRPSSVQRVERPRWFVLPASDDQTFREEDPDGTQRVITIGMRVAVRQSGELRRGTELLPASDNLRTMRLPDRLGGGYLFWSSSEGHTSFWRARDWTAKLEPVVRVPFEVSTVHAGFDRLYALHAQTRQLTAIEPTGSRLLDAQPLPAAPGYGGMAFADSWLAAVETDIRGVLVTFDAGASWRGVDLRMSVPGITEEAGQVVLNTAQGRFLLEPTGVMRKLEGVGGDSLFHNPDLLPFDISADEAEADAGAGVSPHRDALGPLGRWPLSRAALRGVADSQTTAVVADAGVLARISLDDGRIIDLVEGAYPEGGACSGVYLGRGLGFICSEETGRSVVYELVAPLSLNPVLSFDTPRYIASSGNGGLVVRGPCAAAAFKKSSLSTYCVRGLDGVTHEVAVKGDIGVERVAALRDGRAAVLVPPRLGAAGALTLIERDGTSNSRKLDLSGVSAAKRSLLEQGLWLDGWVEPRPGELRGWVAADVFAGVAVSLNGKVDVGPVQLSVDRALLSGSLGLLLGEHGAIRETVDGGQTWRDATELPKDFAEHATTMPQPGGDRSVERGCTPVGCAFGPWVRIGWSDPGTRERLRVAATPPATSAGPQSFVRWSVQCSPAGPARATQAAHHRRALAPLKGASAIRGRATRLGDGTLLESSAWRPFLGVPAPDAGPQSMRFDFGTEDALVQLRGYVWGPMAPTWNRRGHWAVRIIDRFKVEGAIWSTAVSTSPWSDPVAAAQLFGSDPAYRASIEWNAVLDPAGDGAILLMRAGPNAEAFVIEKDRSITPVEGAGAWALDRPAGAVKVGSTWYAGSAPGPRLFRIIAVEGGRTTLLGSYPRHVEGLPAQVVRSARGDALAIWSMGPPRIGGASTAWYIFPIDVETGEAGPPILVPHDWLLSVPPPCDPDDEGWVVVHAISPSLSNIDFDGADSLRAAHFEARLLVSRDAICTDALAAQLEGGPLQHPPSARSVAERPTIPLSLTDRATDRRWEFRCSP